MTYTRERYNASRRPNWSADELRAEFDRVQRGIAWPTVVDVRDFGVRGNGVSDDTAALQRAVTATAGASAALFIPPRYSVGVSDMVSLTSNIEIIGGDGSRVIALEDSSPAPAMLGAFGTSGARLSNIRLTNLRVDGNVANRERGDPDDATHLNNIELEYVDNVVVSGLHSHDAAWNGIVFTQCSRFNVSDSYIHDTSKNGVYVSAGCSLFRVSDNIFKDIFYAGWLPTFDFSYSAVGILGGQGGVVSGNSIQNARVGVGVVDSSNNLRFDLVIANNTVWDARDVGTPADGDRLMNYGILVFEGGTTTPLPQPARVVVSGNTCRNALQHNYFIQNEQRVALSGNIGEAAEVYNYKIDNCDDVVIDGCIGMDANDNASGGAGLRIQSSRNVLVDGCRFGDTRSAGSKTQAVGISILLDSPATADTDGVTIIGCNLAGNGSLPIAISGSTFNLTNFRRGLNHGDDFVRNNGDADVTLTVLDGYTQRFTTALTANRTVTLPAIGRCPEGVRFRVSRPAAGAFTLDVGGLKSLAASEWCDVESDGSAWRLVAYGAL